MSASPVELRIQAWGYWTRDVVSAFGTQVRQLAERLASHSVFMLDAKNLKPQGREGQEALRVVFRALSTVEVDALDIISTDAMGRMQLTRLLRECGVDTRAHFVDGFVG